MSSLDAHNIPYSPQAKNALAKTPKEMRRLGDSHFITEHILLGILSNEGGMPSGSWIAWACRRRP